MAEVIINKNFNIKFVVNFYTKLFWPVFITYVFYFLMAPTFSNSFKFIDLLFLLMGILPESEIFYWGDWYIGVYFWSSLIILGIFSINNKKVSLCVLGVIVYLSLMLKLFGAYPKFMGTYLTIIGSELPRGFASIGIGVFSRFITIYLMEFISKIKLSALSSCILSFLYLISYVYIFIFAYIKTPPNGYFYCQLWFAVILIFSYLNLGYFSLFLNKLSFINHISKYSYCVFCAQMLACRIVHLHKDFLVNNGINIAAFIFSFSILFGIFVYAIIKFIKCHPSIIYRSCFSWRGQNSTFHGRSL